MKENLISCERFEILKKISIAIQTRQPEVIEIIIIISVILLDLHSLKKKKKKKLVLWLWYPQLRKMNCLQCGEVHLPPCTQLLSPDRHSQVVPIAGLENEWVTLLSNLVLPGRQYGSFLLLLGVWFTSKAESDYKISGHLCNEKNSRNCSQTR